MTCPSEQCYSAAKRLTTGSSRIHYSLEEPGLQMRFCGFDPSLLLQRSLEQFLLSRLSMCAETSVPECSKKESALGCADGGSTKRCSSAKFRRCVTNNTCSLSPVKAADHQSRQTFSLRGYIVYAVCSERLHSRPYSILQRDPARTSSAQ